MRLFDRLSPLWLLQLFSSPSSCVYTRPFYGRLPDQCFRRYIIFANEDLIPLRISIHEHPGDRQEQPTGPNPEHQWAGELSERDLRDLEFRNQLPLEEVLDPYLEKFGAIFGGILFALTLVAILVTNALHVGHGVYIITVPAAFLMLCRDLIYDWWTRDQKQQNGEPQATQGRDPDIEPGHIQHGRATTQSPHDSLPAENVFPEKRESDENQASGVSYPPTLVQPPQGDVKSPGVTSALAPNQAEMTLSPQSVNGSNKTLEFPKSDSPTKFEEPIYSDTRGTLYGLCEQLAAFWERLPFPTVKTILSHLPFALVPFAFCMFIIVEGLVTKGWVEILAKGWAIWANKSNPAVAIAGMGFVSVCLCNVSDLSPNFFWFFFHPVSQFAGTNIGATILLSRVLQSWLSEHTPSERMVNGTVR